MQATHIERVRSAGLEKNQLAAWGIDDDVQRSWRRCLTRHKLDPTDKQVKAVLDNQSLNARREKLGGLLDVAVEESRNIYSQTRGSGFAIIVTDAQGAILSWTGDPTLDKEFAEAGLCDGALWDEQHEGTNGIGTCISENRAVLIHKEDHFFSRHVALTCAGVPVRNPSGDIIAVLDASSVGADDTKSGQIYTLALLRMSARRIEHWNFLHEFGDKTVVRVNRRPEMMGTLDDGLMAVDEDGNILAVNDTAYQELGKDTRLDLLGKNIGEMFEFRHNASNNSSLNCLQNAQAVGLPQGQNQFVTSVQKPITLSKPRKKTGQKIPKAEQEVVKQYFRKEQQLKSELQTATQLLEQRVPIHVQGETGTGKETVARALHASTSFSKKPFVTLQWEKLPETLDDPRQLIMNGLFASDDSGFSSISALAELKSVTLYLNDVGQLSLSEQIRLIRLLERLHGPTETHGPRIISSSNFDLVEKISRGEFRKDLYYRVAGYVVQTPALRERNNLQGLIEAICQRVNQGREMEIASDAMDVLLSYDWPGNMRELDHALTTAVALSSGAKVEKHHIALNIVDAVKRISLQPATENEVIVGGSTERLRSSVDAAEREAIIVALEDHKWNVTKTAIALKISRKTLYRKFERHEINFRKLH